MKLNIKKIKEDAKKDFEKTWVETARLLPKKTQVNLRERHGQEHVFRKMSDKLRRIFLDTGFNETENLCILPAEDVYREYGPEAAVILDRVFYLAKLPRPDIGLGKEKILQIKKLIGKFSEAKLKEILRDYKKGKIESDDLTETLVEKLNIKTEQATGIITLFSEFKKLKPQITDLTLRSHMTAVWYHTLGALQNKKDFPIALFSLGLRYRNEQKEDASHLRVHHSASIVIMDPEMSLDAGAKIVKQLIEKIGFKEVKFVKKQATSKYYADELEKEIFVKHKGGWLEVGDIGMYSPISLANFGIEYPVFNAGFGIERLAMVLEGYDDIRKLMFPQFYSEAKFSDKAIADSVYIIKKPNTKIGKEIAKMVKKTAEKHKDKIAPVEFIAWKGKINTRDVKVKIIEIEEGKRLIGPAGFNKIIVKDGTIIGSARTEGVATGFDYIDGLANKIASDVENRKKSFEYRVRAVRSLRDINLDIPKDVQNYIKANHKKIGIKGSVFMTVKVEIS
jgi:O-phosphoseryl-tRNA synthetase